MQIVFSKKFEKLFKKQSPRIKQEFYKRLELLEKDPANKILRIHKLSGELKGKYSINVSGDVRAIYEIVDDKIYFFLLIGTHSELYH